jgi:hypothetical protein
MNSILEQELVTMYPELFRDKDKPVTESLMAFGCECDDGWFTIIKHVCACIASHTKSGGWKYEAPYRFFQLKEKYAGLRIYDNGHDDYIAGVIAMAESLSYVTCETCGKPGRVCCAQGGYWLKTLCPEHMREFSYRTSDGGDDF